MGSSAFATGSSVAFAKGSPDLHTAAHEAAHVVQQQQGVSLKEGVGQVGDRYEQHADEVADAVVVGKSTEGLLGEIAPGGGGTAVQFDKPEKSAAEDTKPSHSETAPKADDVVGGVGGLLEYQGLLRELYNKADAAIDAEILYMQSKGVPEEQIAKWAVKARNEAKVKIRKWDPAKTWAEQRNLAKYGDKVGPSHSQLKNGDPSHKIKPKSNKQIIEGATRTNTGLNTWAGRLRIAGRIMLAVDLVISGYRVWVAPPKDRPKVFIKEATGLAGALAGGLLGAKGGTMVGGTAGAAFAGVGAAPGAAAGGILGAIGGAIAGAWGGAQVGNWLVEELYPPTDTGFEQ